MWKMTQKLFSQVQQSRVGNALCQRAFTLTSGPNVDYSLFDATLPAGAYRARYQGGKMQNVSVACS
jgi:hypothetical protein